MSEKNTSPHNRRHGHRGRPHIYPPPAWSERVFLEINPHDVHMFRYLLEAYDNLGYMSVVDRWRAVLRVSYSPHQRQEFLETLEGMGQTVSFRMLPSSDITGPDTEDNVSESMAAGDNVAVNMAPQPETTTPS